MPVQIVAIKPFRTEERHHAGAVGGHRAIGVSGFGMALYFRRALMRGGLPQNVAGLLIQAENFPLLNVIVIRRSWISV